MIFIYPCCAGDGDGDGDGDDDDDDDYDDAQMKLVSAFTEAVNKWYCTLSHVQAHFLCLNAANELTPAKELTPDINTIGYM